ncbi:MAG: hypothetical protein SVV67_00385 [Bacillota bacterium]|nr:hypothetical protein [Bacillota bacterium]
MNYTEKIYAVSPVTGEKTVSTARAVAFSMSKRLDSLDKKTIYLVDTGFGGSAYFMVALQKWFKENWPSVTTIRKRKPGNVFVDDEPSEKLWNEIREKGDAAILGVAG